MPIYLPPLSRRQFLAGAAAAASSLLMGDALRGADESTERDPHRFALLSDTHIAADRAAVTRGVTMSDHLMKAVAEVAALSPRPAGAAINGDLALGTGESGDYAVLLDLIAPLRSADVPVYLGLGNHDHRDRFRDALPPGERIATQMKDRRVHVVKSPRASWFILDSLRETNEVAGELGEAQLRWLAEALDRDKAHPALIVVHHNPDPIDPTRGGLADTNALLSLLLARPNAKAVFFGHSHHWSVTQELGLHLVNLPAVAYVFREGDPSGWVDVKLAEAGATLELRCLDPSHKLHGEKHELKWRKG